LKSERPVVPQVAFVEAGKQDAWIFDQYLLEDHGLDASTFGLGCSNFDDFLTQLEPLVAKEVQQVE